LAKNITDWFALSFIAIFVFCPWWIYFDGFVSIGSDKLPIQIYVLLIDLFPLVFGLIWLSLRYPDAIRFIARWKIHHAVVVMIVAPLFLVKWHMR
jgi:hypothetical protein